MQTKSKDTTNGLTAQQRTSTENMYMFIVQGAARHELRVLQKLCLVGEQGCLVEVHILVRKVHHRHISQYLKFQKLLEFISCQLAVSPMIFSELLTHMKTICLFGFSGIVATYLT